MTMAPGRRERALTARVTSSVGRRGAVAVILALAIAGLTSQNTRTVGGAYLALEPITRFVLVLFALATLFSSEPGRGREYTTAATRAARLTVRDALASL